MLGKCKKIILSALIFTLLFGGTIAPVRKSYAAISPSNIPLPTLDLLKDTYATQGLPPIYNTVEEAERDGAPNRFIALHDGSNRDLGGYTEYVYKRTSTYKQKDVGWHPDFDRYRCNVNSYGFSTSATKTMTVQVEYKNVTVTIAKQSTSGSFFTIPADANKCSRPYVKADVAIKYYDVKYFDNFGQHYQTITDGHSTTSSSNSNYYVKYQ